MLRRSGLLSRSTSTVRTVLEGVAALLTVALGHLSKPVGLARAPADFVLATSICDPDSKVACGSHSPRTGSSLSGCPSKGCMSFCDASVPVAIGRAFDCWELGRLCAKVGTSTRENTLSCGEARGGSGKCSMSLEVASPSMGGFRFGLRGLAAAARGSSCSCREGDLERCVLFSQALAPLRGREPRGDSAGDGSMTLP